MKKLILHLLFLFCASSIFGQIVSNDEIKQRIQLYKSDLRGPYKEIRWFCPDGSIIPPKERCPEPGGVQRARYKDEVTKLAETNHVFLGQILATTPYDQFWDSDNYNSRLKQYQLEIYLRMTDNGWILRRAQYYRGAFQAEDEEQWGINFFNWLLLNDEVIEKQFFLIRQAAKDIPHKGDDNLKQEIRLGSKLISDSYAPFLDLRVKIHGQPELSDVEKVKEFRDKHKTKMVKEDQDKMDVLVKNMEKLYKPLDINFLNAYLTAIPKSGALYQSLLTFQLSYKNSISAIDKISLLAHMMEELRSSVLNYKSAETRLAILDISIALEDILFKEQAAYKASNLMDNITNIRSLGSAATACGYLELWEWEQLKKRLDLAGKSSLSESEIFRLFESCRNITEWGTAMFSSVYEDVVNMYAGFEHMSNGFIDEKVRSSLLLQVGRVVNNFGENLSALLPVSNQLMDISGQTAARGLNPGYAKGELVVITGQMDATEFDKNKIYVFNKPPADLKPVAGIATVSEGNPVSHIQLLARNLGIPNAVISLQNLEDLKKYSGRTVFYAVSSKGVVIMKPEDAMNIKEKALFEKNKRVQEKMAVPVDKIDLKYRQIINLRAVNASSSGRICGPKAANLGQLKQMFPDNVVEGLVIPFGVFQEHLLQPMPGQDISYWEYLNQIFKSALTMHTNGSAEVDVENFMTAELAKFRKYVQEIKLSEEFINELNVRFRKVFGKELGELPVFLRSDTNMEDLKNFTGAGLNLTVFNVVSTDQILQSIRDVWASPYTERSYRWRQRYLTNPENVFPSILIIPSVNVDCSGVMVTKGLGTGSLDDITIAFSRGAGGAVDGQAAESYLIKKHGEVILLTPARETVYKTLPLSGNIKELYTTFEKPLLDSQNIASLQNMARSIQAKLSSSSNMDSRGPYDIELGFKNNQIWLFQVRPFVENKNAVGQLYLESLNPVLSDKILINLMETVKP